ncbi:cupin domain-containing protein [Pseudorhodoplanes sp.]|uniref:cupin domain-containing protein n=1 Tax=Pseudorhodoplanes sp. TaxID=1934341 RepID=UPI0039C92A63
MVEGDGVTTTVDGKDCPMKFGDLVLTPDWGWHGHRHEGKREAMWLDVLDVPLHNYLGTARFEPPPMIEVPPRRTTRSIRCPTSCRKRTSAGEITRRAFVIPMST